MADRATYRSPGSFRIPTSDGSLASPLESALIRNLLGRMPSRKLTSCRAKISASFRAFFKKWVALEKRIGEEQGAEEVKGRAVKWTQRAAAHSAGDEA
ncbi:hypothetical protein BJY52DRAFT_1317486 [Lactarius psammicola]|nr:hypothetical protein BJY52DRAFT_1317486 [Lactarius psammicola]